MLALLFVTLPFVVRAVQPVLIELDREMEEAAASLGAARSPDLPADHPAQPAPGDPLRVSRSPSPARIGEFGSLVLISGNIPFKTEVASVYIFGQIESDDAAGAAAVSVVLLRRARSALLIALDLLAAVCATSRA